ncbi:MAG: FtsW/RodA/SpoVE family cell cycle protein [Clostridia bacterium]|nr:FtsW/RodA/SpoVE family cell cycle protein [Clostridia bacterium]
MSSRTARATAENPARRVQTPAEADRGRGAKRPSAKKKKKQKWFGIGLGIDMPFLLIVLILLTIGITMMFSASYPVAYAENKNSYHYLTNQLIFAGVGVAFMIAASFFNYRVLYSAAKLLLAFSYFVLIIVLFMPGVNGVHRWIGFPSFNVQASEITKFCLIVFFAYWGTKYADKIKYMKYSLLPGAVVFASTAVLLILEPHFSCTVIVFLLIMIMLFISGMDIKYFVAIGILVAAAVAIMWATGLLGYAMERLDGWGKALEYSTPEMWQTTWQTRNSLYAIGSGGLNGLGLGQSRQKYLYLPEPQNDFVFAIVCEELGFVGAAIILCLFGFLVYHGIRMSLNASDTFGKLLGVGLTSQVGLQVILNIFVITDWLPNTGISLPFFSYGGSSLLMLLGEMGIVLSISRSAKIEKR